MGTRLELQKELESICERVYFQPPSTVRMTYPCIVYNLSDVEKNNANNQAYIKTRAYSVTVISRDPDEEYFDQIIDKFPMTSLSSTYVADNLNHWNLLLYY